MVFVESPWFSAWRAWFLGDEQFWRLVDVLLRTPDAGALIPGGRGLRKLRIGLPGRGKRGGARVIYFYRATHDRILLLYGYAKNRQADLTPDQLRRLGTMVEEELRNE